MESYRWFLEKFLEFLEFSEYFNVFVFMDEIGNRSLFIFLLFFFNVN